MGGIALSFAGAMICIASGIATFIVWLANPIAENPVSTETALAMLALCQSTGLLLVVCGIIAERKEN